MLTEDEIEKLRQAIVATVASPLIGSIEDYTWEAIFHYVKDISLADPALGRSKLLYDAVDPETSIGWSLKSLQVNKKADFSVGTIYSYVIQRADVIKKADELGFPGLNENSSPDELGEAIVRHWNQKVEKDSLKQALLGLRGIMYNAIRL